MAKFKVWREGEDAGVMTSRGAVSAAYPMHEAPVSVRMKYTYDNAYELTIRIALPEEDGSLYSKVFFNGTVDELRKQLSK